MAWTQVCHQYDGTFAGFLTCVFESYVNHEEPVEFRGPEDPCCSLYPLRTIATHPERATRVYRSLGPRLGPEGREWVIRGFLTCLPQRELYLWRFLRMGFCRGPAVIRELTDPRVDKLRKAVLFLNREAHLYTGFTRFSDLHGVLAGEIQPKNRVLPLLRPHFCGRYPQEKLVLHDSTHGEALFHQPGKWAILPVEGFTLGPAGAEELAFRQMWRAFYDTIAIEGRRNEKCRMTQMPKRYWAAMTEFQKDWDTALPQVAGQKPPISSIGD